MNKSDTIFFKQVLIFSFIIFSAIALSYAAAYFKDEIASIGLQAAAAANEGGKAFGALLKEDLDPNP